MKHAHTHHLTAWAAAFALTLPCLGTAQAQVMAQSSATISGLKIRLIDLDTKDGITPSISMVGNLAGFTYNDRPVEIGVSSLVPGTINGANSPPEDSWTPLLSLQNQLAGGSAVVPATPAGTSLKLGSTLSASTSVDLQRAVTVTEDVSYSVPAWQYNPATGNYDFGTESFTGQQTRVGASGDAAVSLMGQPLEDGYISPYLRVSPHTLVVIEGTSTLSATVDAQRVLTLQATDPSLRSYLSGGANASLSISLSQDRALWPNDPAMAAYGQTGASSSFTQGLGLGYDMNGFYANTGANAEELLVLEELNLPASGLLTRQQTGQFRVSMANTSADATDMLLTLNLASVSEHARQSLSAPGVTFTPDAPTPPEVPTIPTVPNIPEPGTWAQMGLGLIGLLAAVRRKRRAA